jgi:Protein of unknown function (DUF3352)
MPRFLITLIVLTTATVAAAGCGSDGSSSSSGAAAVAPAGSIVYGEVTLRPEGDQKAAIEDLVTKFPGEGSAGDRIQRLMETLFAEAETPLSYREDVEPWLGDEAAFYISSIPADGEDPDAALLLATEDEDATVDAIDKASDARKTEHNGHDLYVYADGEESAAVFDGWLALGTPPAVKAAIDTAEGGEAIEDDKRYRETLEDAPEDRLGFVYVDMPGLYERLRQQPGVPVFGPFRQLFEESIVVTASADEHGVRFEGVIPATLVAGFPVISEGSGAAGELPGDSWFALAQPDLGQTIEGYLDFGARNFGGRDVMEEQFRSSTGLDLEEDVISWMGDWSVFVRGTSVDSLNGAIVIETSDEEASGRFIDGVARVGRRSMGPGTSIGPLELPGGGEGVTMRSQDVPQPIHLFQRDGKVVAAYGDAAARDALDPAETLAESADFTQAEEALGGDYAVSFFLAFEPILALAEAEGAAADEDYQKAKPYLEPLGAIVGGASEDGDKLRSAFALTVK